MSIEFALETNLNSLELTRKETPLVQKVAMGGYDVLVGGLELVTKLLLNRDSEDISEAFDDFYSPLRESRKNAQFALNYAVLAKEMKSDHPLAQRARKLGLKPHRELKKNFQNVATPQ